MQYVRSRIGRNLVVAKEWLRVGYCTHRNVIPKEMAARLLLMSQKTFKKLGDEVHYKNGPRMVRVRDKYSHENERLEHNPTGVLEFTAQQQQEIDDIAYVKIAAMNLIKQRFKENGWDAQADSLTIEDISSTDFLQSRPGAVKVSSICMVCVLLKNFSRYVRVFVFVFV